MMIEMRMRVRMRMWRVTTIMIIRMIDFYDDDDNNTVTTTLRILAIIIIINIITSIIKIMTMMRMMTTVLFSILTVVYNLSTSALREHLFSEIAVCNSKLLYGQTIPAVYVANSPKVILHRTDNFLITLN